MTRKARTPKTSVRPKLVRGVSRQEDTVVDPVWTVYFDGRPNEISRAACGYTLDEWLAGGRDFFKQVATPQSLANIRAATHAVRTRGVTLHNVECEIRGKEPDRHYHFLINYQPVFNGANEIVGVRGDARDVTELMQFERALGRGAGLLVSLIESTGDLFWAFYFNDRPGFASRDCCGFNRREWANGGLRLRGKNDELIAPGAFLSPAERFGLMHAIDRWVVRHALARLAALRAAGQVVRFSINLSGRAFNDPELLATIERAIGERSIEPSAVTFEVTETVAIARMTDAKAFIARLKAIGCQFALDDFGSGFSSYSYLKYLPADYLKIDGAFVQGLADDPVDQAIVQSMNQVAHASGKKTIAEFVENARSLELLRRYGVDFAQGYHVGRPSESLVIER